MVNPTSKRKRTLENSSEKRPHSHVASGKRSHSRCVIDFTRNDCPRFEMDGGADAIPLLDALKNSAHPSSAVKVSMILSMISEHSFFEKSLT